MNKAAITLAAFCMLLSAGCITPTQTSYTRDEMDQFMWLDYYKSPETGIAICSRLFVPRIESPLPVIVFLHGAGQKGYDNKTQLYEGDVGKVVYYADKSTKAIVAVPQCPLDREWPDKDMLVTLDGYVKHVLATLKNADPTRIYLTGFSMGGIGTFELARHSPDRFAAIMPVCGGWRSWTPWTRPEVPSGMLTMSIWAFNNINDEVVDNLYSKYVVSEMWAASNTNAHYTEGYDGHTDESVFADSKNLKWLLSQEKAPDRK